MNRSNIWIQRESHTSSSFTRDVCFRSFQLVCLFFSRLTQHLLHRFSQNLAEGWDTGQERSRQGSLTEFKVCSLPGSIPVIIIIVIIRWSVHLKSPRSTWHKPSGAGSQSEDRRDKEKWCIRQINNLKATSNWNQQIPIFPDSVIRSSSVKGSCSLSRGTSSVWELSSVHQKTAQFHRSVVKSVRGICLVHAASLTGAAELGEVSGRLRDARLNSVSSQQIPVRAGCLGNEGSHKPPAPIMRPTGVHSS